MYTSKNHSFSILFWVNKERIQSNNELPIYVRVTVDGRRVEISLQRTTPAELWNQQAQCLKGKGSTQTIINGTLDLVKGKIQSIYNQLLSSGTEITSTLIKEIYTGKDTKSKHKTIMEAYDYHNIKMRELVKVGKVVSSTVKRHEITQNKVKVFMQLQYKTNDKALPEMRLAFITEFEHYLLTVDKIQNNTAHKYIKNLKKVMNMAVGLDWIPANPFNNFKCSYHNPDREILNPDELNTIMNKDYGSDRMNEVRDVFIFCCYTGFAYSDIYKFEKNAVLKGLDGNLWLSTNRQKTGNKESVPLLPIPLAILQKYQDHHYCIKHNKLLPINSNQRYNSYLKELADLVSIKKNLTSHIARHTFATTVTLANGVPIETVSKMLGHQNIRTTQIYAKVVEQKVSDDMNILRTKFLTISNQKEEKNLKIG